MWKLNPLFVLTGNGCLAWIVEDRSPGKRSHGRELPVCGARTCGDVVTARTVMLLRSQMAKQLTLPRGLQGLRIIITLL